MLCPSCKADQNTPKREGTIVVWCPTWISADDPPRAYCEEHSRVFIEKHNPNAKGGDFFFNEDANTAYHSVESFINRKKDEPLYENAKGMILNGHILFQKNRPAISLLRDPFYRCLAIVDGKAWLLTDYLATNLGDHVEAKHRFPNLFKEL